jgi:hypothetical protein
MTISIFRHRIINRAEKCVLLRLYLPSQVQIESQPQILINFNVSKTSQVFYSPRLLLPRILWTVSTKQPVIRGIVADAATLPADFSSIRAEKQDRMM